MTAMIHVPASLAMNFEVGVLTVEMPWYAQYWSADIYRVSMTILLLPSAVI